MEDVSDTPDPRGILALSLYAHSAVFSGGLATLFPFSRADSEGKSERRPNPWTKKEIQ